MSEARQVEYDDASTCEHEACGCGNQPPYHCMYCCVDFNDDELRRLGLPPYYVNNNVNTR